MKRQTIYLSMTTFDKDGKPEPGPSRFPVEAFVTKGLAVHESDGAGDWAITHVATGKAVASSLWYKEALAKRKLLLLVPMGQGVIDWTRQDIVEAVNQDESVKAAIKAILSQATEA